MAAELITGLGIFKDLLDSAKGLKDINDATVRNSVSIELQEKILAAQAQQTALVERISDLEKEVASFETWEAEKENYEFSEVASGITAYTIKESVRGTKPVHHICGQCYDNNRKSVLQPERWQAMRSKVLVCHQCGTVLYLSGQPHADHAKLRPKPARA